MSVPCRTVDARIFAPIPKVLIDANVHPVSLLKRTTKLAKVGGNTSKFHSNSLGIFKWILDIDECASDNGGCSHTCVNMPSSYKCTCPEGYTLGEDWTTCQDIDECAESNLATCGSVGTCFNVIGSYRCLCPSGYKENDMGCDGKGSIDL